MYFLLEAAATKSLFSVLMANTMPFVVVLGVMYFMLISPQKKREKRMQDMRNSLEIGDGVITAAVLNKKEENL